MQSPGFDKTNVNLIGFKLAINSELKTNFNYAGTGYLKEIKLYPQSLQDKVKAKEKAVSDSQKALEEFEKNYQESTENSLPSTESPPNKTNYLFNGKELDSETGLYFYGARYYDAQLGRWISADPTIQHPYDPQDLNRYTYCRNNPINLKDPTGLGWKSFWKKFKNIFISVIAAAATVFTFGAIAPGMTAMAALFSRAGAVVVSSAGATTEFMDSEPERQFTKWLGKEVFDDIFGMSPKTALKFANIFGYMAVNASFQFGFAQLYGANKTITSVKDYNADTDKEIAKQIIQEGKGTNFGMKPAINPKTGDPMDVSKILYHNDESIGLIAKALDVRGKQHIGIIMKGSSLQSDLHGFFNSPFKATGELYNFFGNSHTMVNWTLVNAGYSTTIGGIGGSWSTIPTTFIFGLYGGGIPNSMVNYSTNKEGKND